MELLTDTIRGALMDFFCQGNCRTCKIHKNVCEKACSTRKEIRITDKEFVDVIRKFGPFNINDLKPEIVETLISLFPKTKLE